MFSTHPGSTLLAPKVQRVAAIPVGESSPRTPPPYIPSPRVDEDVPGSLLSPGELYERAVREEMNKPYQLIMAGYFIRDDFARIQRFCDRYEEQMEKGRLVLLKHVQEAFLEILRFYNQETRGLYETHLIAWYNEFAKMTEREKWGVHRIIKEAEVEIAKGLLRVFEEHHRVRLGLDPSMYSKDPFYKNICNLTAIYKQVDKKYLLKESLRLWSDMPLHMNHVVMQFTPMLN